MKPLETIPLTEENFDILGPKDKLIDYKSKWPIYVLHSVHSEGIWIRFNLKLDILEYQNKLQDITKDDIEDFLEENLDIAFELHFFEDFLPDYYFFKFENKMYCYSIGKKGKDKVRMYVRFYFDLGKLIND